MLTKEQFINYINRLQSFIDYNEEINSLQTKYKKEIYSSDYDMFDVAVSILMDMFRDNENDNIGYFIYELDFGRKYKDGMIKDNNVNIRMSNAEELYDYLVLEMKRGE